MLKGEKVLLRPMKRDDIARMHELSQDPELYVLNCAIPRPRLLRRLRRITRTDERTMTTLRILPLKRTANTSATSC